MKMKAPSPAGHSWALHFYQPKPHLPPKTSFHETIFFHPQPNPWAL